MMKNSTSRHALAVIRYSMRYHLVWISYESPGILPLLITNHKALKMLSHKWKLHMKNSSRLTVWEWNKSIGFDGTCPSIRFSGEIVYPRLRTKDVVSIHVSISKITLKDVIQYLTWMDRSCLSYLIPTICERDGGTVYEGWLVPLMEWSYSWRAKRQNTRMILEESYSCEISLYNAIIGGESKRETTELSKRKNRN